MDRHFLSPQKDTQNDLQGSHAFCQQQHTWKRLVHALFLVATLLVIVLQLFVGFSTDPPWFQSRDATTAHQVTLVARL